MAATAAESGQGAFVTRIMAGITYMALPIPRLIAVEVVELLLPAPRKRSVVAVTWVKAVVDMAVKAVMAVKPGACPNKYATVKPIGSIVAIGRTVIRSIVKVPVRAYRRHSDADSDLGLRLGQAAEQGNGEN
jgi:hypothetical protein